jgi:hypothetical protein
LESLGVWGEILGSGGFAFDDALWPHHRRTMRARFLVLESKLVDRFPHVRDVEVAVDHRGQPRIGVAEDPLHDRERDTFLEQEGGGCVPQVMETDVVVGEVENRDGGAPRRDGNGQAGTPVSLRSLESIDKAMGGRVVCLLDPLL